MPIRSIGGTAEKPLTRFACTPHACKCPMVMGWQFCYFELPCRTTSPLAKVKSAQTTLPLTVLLADTPEDDNSGQIATQGFGYQEWYAVLLVTELLEKSDDFAVGLEVKEDVSVIDSATAPNKVEFCQVKTNEQAAAWVFAELHRKGRKLKDGTHPPSILGKLFNRRHQFAGHKTTLRFVSNSSFKVPHGGDTVNTHDYHLDNLSEESKKTLRQALSEQLSVASTDIELSG